MNKEDFLNQGDIIDVSELVEMKIREGKLELFIKRGSNSDQLLYSFLNDEIECDDEEGLARYLLNQDNFQIDEYGSTKIVPEEALSKEEIDSLFE